MLSKDLVINKKSCLQKNFLTRFKQIFTYSTFNHTFTRSEQSWIFKCKT